MKNVNPFNEILKIKILPHEINCANKIYTEMHIFFIDGAKMSRAGNIPVAQAAVLFVRGSLNSAT